MMLQTLALTGPINVADFRDYIAPSQWRDDLPKGQGGTPVNLLGRELLRRGQRLLVISTDEAVRDEIVLKGDLLTLCLGPKGIRPARNFFRVEREYVQRTLQREKPQLIHANWTYEYAMPVLNSGIPHVITAHDAPINILRHNFIPYRIARTLMAYRVTSRAPRIVSVSPYVAKHLRRFMLYRGAAEVVPNGMPEHVFEREAAAAEKDRPFTFATILVGWGGYKNGNAAIDAFAHLRASYRQARLLMFGHAHGVGEHAQHYAQQKGVADGIEFVGQVAYPQLMQRLANEVDVLVHPALEEAQPMALIEAMAMGIPVIGGQYSGGVPWTLDEGRAGMLVDVRSSPAIAAAMQRMMSDESLRRSLSRLGQQHARARFHIRAVADAYQAIYQDVLSKNEQT